MRRLLISTVLALAAVSVAMPAWAGNQAVFSLSVTATFQPDCTPPMTLVFSDVSVCDATHDLCKTFSGTY